MSRVTPKSSSSADDLVFEHATNRRYLDELARFLGVPVTYGLPRNEVWAGNLRSGKSYDVLGPLFGRVGLDYDDDLAGRTFYIGPRLMTRDGLTVFSWVAPWSLMTARGTTSTENGRRRMGVSVLVPTTASGTT